MPTANHWRARYGAPPLVWQWRAQAASRERAIAMARADVAWHDLGPARRYFTGYCWRWLGELVAWHRPALGVGDTFRQWMSSDAHRTILLARKWDRGGGFWATSATGTRYHVLTLADRC